MVPLLTAFRRKDSKEIGGTEGKDAGGWEEMIFEIPSSTNHSVIQRNIQVGLSSGGSFSDLQLTPGFPRLEELQGWEFHNFPPSAPSLGKPGAVPVVSLGLETEIAVSSHFLSGNAVSSLILRRYRRWMMDEIPTHSCEGEIPKAAGV